MSGILCKRLRNRWIHLQSQSKPTVFSSSGIKNRWFINQINQTANSLCSLRFKNNNYIHIWSVATKKNYKVKNDFSLHSKSYILFNKTNIMHQPQQWSRICFCISLRSVMHASLLSNCLTKKTDECWAVNEQMSTSADVNRKAASLLNCQKATTKCLTN